MRQQQRFTAGHRIRILILVLLFALIARPVEAQLQIQIGPRRMVPIGPQPGLSPPRSDSTFFPRNRELTRILNRAEKSITEKRYNDAVQFLQTVLDTVDREADAFFVKPSEDGTDPVNVSIRSYAHSLLASLPSEGRQAYELLVGQSARELLNRGTETGQTEQIESAARRYPLTKAGRQASLMLARLHMDRNEPMEAALQYSRLMKSDRRPSAEIALRTALCWAQAKLPDAANRVLLELKQRSDSIQLGGKTIQLFADGESPLGWLESTLATAVTGPPQTVSQWDRPFGNAERNAPGAPLATIGESLWSTSLFDVVDVPDNIRERMQQFGVKYTARFQDNVGHRLPAGQPLVVGTNVIYRAFGKLQAVSLGSGELQWESASLDPSMNSLIRYQDNRPGDSKTGTLTRTVRRPITSTVNELFDQRVWRDLTSATLSSDGRHVFSIEEVGLASGGLSAINSANSRGASTFNLLRAYDVDTGKTVWQVGGQLRDNSSSMDGYFFLGPPLLLGDRLYVLAEMREQILLLALREEQDVDNHWIVKPEWTLVIANAGVSVAHDHVRRLSGISPTYADGKLICPTSAGACVAVDLVDRSPVWGYQYKQSGMRMLGGRPVSGSVSRPGWMESSPRLAGQVVVLTPADFHEIHGLDLSTGRRLWKQQQQQRRYVAATDSNRIVIVGKSRVEALDPDTGTVLWDTSLADELVAGFGVVEGDRYHVPLATGKVVTLQMTNGRILSKSGSIVPGNLISTDQALLSLSPASLTAYPSRADLGRRLQTDSQTPDRLVQKAVYQLQHGEIEPSLVDLRKALALNEDDSSARELLRDTLLAGLRVDATHGTRMEELGRLLANDDSPEARDVVWQLANLKVSRIMKNQGYADAFAELMNAANSRMSMTELKRVDAKREIRFDRWLFTGVQKILRQVPATDRAGLDQVATSSLTGPMAVGTTRLSSAVTIGPTLPTNSNASADEQRLAKIVAVLRGLDSADRLHRQWLESLDPATDPLAVEFALLNQLRRPEHQAEATWRLIRLYATHTRYDLVAPLLDDLRLKFGDVTIVDGKTAAALAEEIAGDPVLSDGLRDARTGWDDRTLAVKKVTRRRVNGIARSSFKPFAKTAGVFAGWSFRWEPSRQILHAVDAIGERRWQTRIKLDATLPLDIGTARVWSAGHLLLLQHRLGMVALDGFSGSELWSMSSKQSRLIRGPSSVVYSPAPLSVLAIQSAGLLYMTPTKFVFADPLTGQILWQRDVSGLAVAVNPLLTVTNDKLAAIPSADGRSAFLIDLLDGDVTHVELQNRVADFQSIISPAALSDARRAIGIHGETLVSVRQQSDTVVVDATNLIADSVSWTRAMNADALVSSIQEGCFSVIETMPDGRRELRVHDVSNGKSLAVVNVTTADKPDRVSIVVTPRHFCVLVNHSKQEPVNIAILSSFQSTIAVNGSMFVIDRRTNRLLWEKPIANKVLLRDHSSALPIYVLLNVESEQARPAGAPFNPFLRRRKYGISILDARNGGELFASNDIGPGLANIRVVAEEPPGTISVQLHSETVMLGAESVINRIARPEIEDDGEDVDPKDDADSKEADPKGGAEPKGGFDPKDNAPKDDADSKGKTDSRDRDSVPK